MSISKIILGSYEYCVDTHLAYQKLLQEASIVHSDSEFSIDTAITYDNAPQLKSLLESNPALKVVSKIAPQMHQHGMELIKHHLSELGREYVDLMLIHNNRCDWIPVAKLLKECQRLNYVKEIGVSNFNIDDLQEYYSEFGHYPDYNEMEVNPLYTNIDLIEFCKDHNIKIIAYCILGGKYKSDYLIKCFTLYGLINYAGYYADHIIIRSDNINHLMNDYYKYDPNYVPTMMDSLNKVIMPLEYTPQVNMAKGEEGILYQRNQQSYDCVPMKDAVKLVRSYQDYHFHEEGEFYKAVEGYEFISDIRVHLRWHLQSHGVKADQDLGEVLRIDDQVVNVYIIDDDGNLSKVWNPSKGYKLLIKILKSN